MECVLVPCTNDGEKKREKKNMMKYGSSWISTNNRIEPPSTHFISSPTDKNISYFFLACLLAFFLRFSHLQYYRIRMRNRSSSTHTHILNYNIIYGRYIDRNFVFCESSQFPFTAKMMMNMESKAKQSDGTRKRQKKKFEVENHLHNNKKR